jgi:hypothetical protein
MSGSMVFIVQHVREISPDVEKVKLIGVYSTEAAAMAAVARARALPGFAESKDGFHVGAHQLDKDNWTEGFVTM